MNKKYLWINRKDFVEKRYKNFKLNKKRLSELGLPKNRYVLSDLNKIYEGDDRPLRDIVLCDRCNENIEDSHFVMFEEQLVYHRSCIKSELPEDFGVSVDNIVFLEDWRNRK